MGVPGHDKRDLEFAQQYGLSVKHVEENGFLINSQHCNGLTIDEGSKVILQQAEETNSGGHMTTYRLRDWLISRQRYWGAPIPMLYCSKCGVSAPVLIHSRSHSSHIYTSS